MIVKCKINRGQDLPAGSWAWIGPGKTRYPLTIDKTYVVCAMMIWGVPKVLLKNDNGAPRWFPLGLFDVVDSTVPSTWKFVKFDPPATSSPQPKGGWQEGDFIAIWGYDELVRSLDHFHGLVELFPADRAIFERVWNSEMDLLQEDHHSEE